MTAGTMRRVATLIGAVLPRVMPRHGREWAAAMRAEIDAIPRDAAALRFAIGCLAAAAAQALHAMLRPLTQGDTAMDAPRPNRLLPIGIACAAGAVLLGLAVMAAGGAPSRHLLVNGGALAIGTGIAAALWCIGPVPRAALGIASAAASAAILAVALFGEHAGGAARWVMLGPLSLQPSLILMPLALAIFARQRDAVTTGAMLAAAAALAVQPDRGMAGALLIGLGALALVRREGWTLAALAGAAAGFAATLLQPDALPATPFVDRILYTAFALHPLAGAALWLGAALMLVPAVAGAARPGPARGVALALGGLWAGVLIAAALGNYPTPLIGYGGSGVLGYLLALPLLAGPRARRTAPGDAAAAEAASPRAPFSARRVAA